MHVLVGDKHSFQMRAYVILFYFVRLWIKFSYSYSYSFDDSVSDLLYRGIAILPFKLIDNWWHFIDKSFDIFVIAVVMGRSVNVSNG